MELFDQLCPTSSRGQRHFCVILPVTDSTKDAAYVRNMRQFAKEHEKQLEKERIRLVYVHANKQPGFVEPFGEHSSEEVGAAEPCVEAIPEWLTCGR